MPTNAYKPAVGETIFVSLSDNLPMLVTITGFHYHPYLKKDVMDFVRLNGATTWATYDDQTFFPEIPTDTPYYYLVTLLDLDVNAGWDPYREDRFFWSPEEAFAYVATLPDTLRDQAIVELRQVS